MAHPLRVRHPVSLNVGAGKRKEDKMKARVGAAFVALLVAGVVVGQEDKAKDGAVQQASEQKITGQCHCGNIKYEAAGPIIKCTYCDCCGCRRATGTLKAPFVTVHRAKFKVTAGHPVEFRATSGAKCDCHGVWHFCPKCGTQVFWKGDKGEELDIFAGTLDDTTLFQPKD